MNKDLSFVIRKPKLPILLFYSGEVYGCKTFKELYLQVVSIDKADKFKIYDVYAKQFSLIESETNYILAPAFVIKPITKKQIVEFYNNSRKGKINPFTKGYSNIRITFRKRNI